MLNSSYTQAGNPNTMRDFGPMRNVLYRMEAASETSSVSQAKSLKSSNWGHPYDEFHQVVKKNDYTKNISDSLFAMGEAASEKPKRTPAKEAKLSELLKDLAEEKKRKQELAAELAEIRG